MRNTNGTMRKVWSFDQVPIKRGFGESFTKVFQFPNTSCSVPTVFYVHVQQMGWQDDIPTEIANGLKSLFFKYE